jgi:hypothetical protein
MRCNTPCSAASKETVAPTSMRRLRFLLAALAFALAGTLGAPLADAQTSEEANSLPCPSQPLGTLMEHGLALNETRQFGNSGMMVRLTRLYDEGGFYADLFLPTVTLRNVRFYGLTNTYDGPIIRRSLCGSTYEIRSSWGHPYLNNMITIAAIPAGF